MYLNDSLKLIKKWLIHNAIFHYGMYIKVKVQAGAKKEEIKQKNKDTFLVRVKEKAERNMANKRICEIMANKFGISVKNIRIISGHQSPSKILSINLVY